jgi:hypothetical protein
MTYFLTENRIKDLTVILGNVDAKLISPLIPTLAEMWIKSRVGSYFYNHLLDVYNNQTANPDEEELISLIQQSLLWRSASDITITTSAQLTNKGPQTQNGLNSNNADITHIGLISKHYTNKAEFFDSRIEAHLRLNKNKYPQFIAKENNDKTITDIVPTKGKGYNTGMYFM